MPRRTDHLVVRDGVSTGIVQVVRPVVDVLWSRFDSSDPVSVLFKIRDPIRSQHAEHFLLRHAVQIVRDDQVGQIVDIGQTVPDQPIDRDIAVHSLRPKMFACLGDVGRVSVQPVDLVAIVDPQNHPDQRRTGAVTPPGYYPVSPGG